MKEGSLSTTAQVQIRAAIQDIAVGPDRGRDITQSHAESVMRSILSDEVDDVQAAIFLIALRMKRESMSEFKGLFSAIATSAESVTANLDHVISLADPFDGYLRYASMTPFIPAVLAANGLACVMHGVKSVGPKHGVTAHKVYELAGANPLMSLNDAASTLDRISLSYVDQSQYAPALYRLQDLRHRMVKRSALTTLERMLMPIKGQRSTQLVLGYVHKAYPEIYTRVAFAAGFDGVILLKGVEGGLAPALNKPMRRFVFNHDLPEDINGAKQIVDTPFMAQASGSGQKVEASEPLIEQCLEQGLAVLNGQNGVARDSLTLACAQIMNAQSMGVSLDEAVEKVQACLDNGTALERFDAFVDQSNNRH